MRFGWIIFLLFGCAETLPPEKGGVDADPTTETEMYCDVPAADWKPVGESFPLDGKTSRPRITFLPNGYPIASWNQKDPLRNDEIDVKVAVWSPAGWTALGGPISVYDLLGQRTNAYEHLVLTTTEDIFVSFKEWDGVKTYVYIVQWTGAGWSEPERVGDGDVGLTVGDFISDGESLYRVWNERTSEEVYHQQIHVAKRVGDSWQQLGEPMGADGVSAQSGKLFVGADGSLFAGWDQAGEIHVRKWDGTSWVPWTIFNDTYSWGASFATYGERTYIAYNAVGLETTSVWLSELTASGVEMPLVLDFGYRDGATVAAVDDLKIDHQGAPLLSFSERVDVGLNQPNELFVTRFHNGVMEALGSQLEPVAGYSAEFGSIAVSPCGIPYVAFRQAQPSGGHKMYVYRFGTPE